MTSPSKLRVKSSYDETDLECDFINSDWKGESRILGQFVASNAISIAYRKLIEAIPSIESGDIIVLVSDIDGLGLFSRRQFQAGEIISLYGGNAIYSDSNGGGRNSSSSSSSSCVGQTLGSSGLQSYIVVVPGPDYHLDAWSWAKSFP